MLFEVGFIKGISFLLVHNLVIIFHHNVNLLQEVGVRFKIHAIIFLFLLFLYLQSIVIAILLKVFLLLFFLLPNVSHLHSLFKARDFLLVKLGLVVGMIFIGILRIHLARCHHYY